MTEGADYDRGHVAGQVAGEISARLANHDKHFTAINGSLDRIATELAAMNLTLQRIDGQRSSDRTGAETTAHALRTANDDRYGRVTRLWTPWARAITAITAVVGLVTVAVLLLG